MMDKGGEGPSKLPPENKAKGKGKDGNVEEGQSTSSLLKDLVQSTRSSVNPANLSSLLAGSGKSVDLSSSARIPDQTINDAQQYQPPQAYSQPHSFKSNVSQLTNRQDLEHEDAYRQFAEMGSSRIDLGIRETLRSSSPVFIGPYSSAQSLDAALHDQVRATSSQWHEMEHAWTAHSVNELKGVAFYGGDAGYHEAWTRSIPRPPSTTLHDMQRGASIDHLLQTVSLSDPPLPLPQYAQTDGASSSVVDLLDEEMRQDIQYSSDERGMSEEQADMHRALHQVQNSEDRANERVLPPNDDDVARTGVFAATPEEALQAIWDGSAEGKRASSRARDSQEAGQNISRKIREVLKRGSYVDDVYGLPPQVQKTIITAEEPETAENRDRKAKAIARLDALYRHLGASSSSDVSIDDFVRNW